ncbi:MAG: diacylglycerol/lipid kinase family protein [Planctomycetota bacterium]|jgi:diacylglycerol kinase family enzyme
MKKVLFLINPASGKLAGQSLKDCIISELDGVLDRGCFDIEYSARDIDKQCNNHLSNYETVVVAAGDGTISQIVKVIAGLEKKPKLGIIPIGTGNDLANSLGILHLYKSQGLGALLKMILRCKVVKMDILGLGNKFIFLNYLGIGSDAKVSCDFDRLRYMPIFRNICSCFLNKAFYGLLALKNIFYRIPFNVEIRYENEHSTTEIISLNKGLCEIVITNTKIYAGMELSSKCSMGDGKFEVTVIRGTWEWIHLLFALLFKKPLDTIIRNLMQFQTDRLELNFAGDTFCQIDGEKYDSFAKGEKRLLVNVVSSCEMIVP